MVVPAGNGPRSLPPPGPIPEGGQPIWHAPAPRLRSTPRRPLVTPPPRHGRMSALDDPLDGSGSRGTLPAMPLLYYWHPRNHEVDLRVGPGFELNSSNPLLHQVDRGEVLWAFTRNADDEYILALRLTIHARVHNHPSHSYGRYKALGREDTAIYYATRAAPSVEPVVRALSVPARAAVLGRSFQGKAHVRRISPADHLLLEVFARDLARIQPFSIDDQVPLPLVASPGSTAWTRPPPADQIRHQALRREALRELHVRDRALVRQLHDLYDHRCQLCGWQSSPPYDVDVAEAHHLKWLSRGGPDRLDNLALLCPNHHRIVHKDNAAFDYKLGSFVFTDRVERLTLDAHLMVQA